MIFYNPFNPDGLNLAVVKHTSELNHLFIEVFKSSSFSKRGTMYPIGMRTVLNYDQTVALVEELTNWLNKTKCPEGKRVLIEGKIV